MGRKSFVTSERETSFILYLMFNECVCMRACMGACVCVGECMCVGACVCPCVRAYVQLCMRLSVCSLTTSQSLLIKAVTFPFNQSSSRTL